MHIEQAKLPVHSDPYVNNKIKFFQSKLEKVFHKFPNDLKKKIKKKIYKGGFMYKNTNEDDINDFFWICRNNKPKDFATLLRFTIMTKLTRSGSLHTRTFISSDG